MSSSSSSSSSSLQWLSLVGIIWLQSINGTNSNFPAYSSQLKNVLSMTQLQLNNLAFASDAGKLLGWFSGIAAIHLPLWIVLMIGSFLGLIGYGVQFLFITNLIPSPSYWQIFLLTVMAGNSICWINTVCYVVSIRNFPCHQQIAVGITTSYQGLSAKIYTDIVGAAFSSSPHRRAKAYLLLNSLLPLVVCVIVAPLVRDIDLMGRQSNMEAGFVFMFVITIATGIYAVISSLGSLSSGLSPLHNVIGTGLFLLVPLVIPLVDKMREVFSKKWNINRERRVYNFTIEEKNNETGHKALPLHMSAVLQSVNRLRFYRTADISNRARVLLSRWSKLLAKNQALEKPNGIKTSSDSGQELVILKQSIDEVMGDESWKSNMDISEDFLGTPFESAENFRKVNASEPLKLLTASSDESNKKNILGVSSSQFRERRKVQLVEQPGQKSAGRSVQATRTTPVSQARPMSADDIQKAKMRAQFMQSKYGKSGSSHENKELKTEGVKKLKTSQASILPVVPKVPIRSNIEEPNIPATYPLKERETPNRPETTIAPKRSMDLKEPILEKCRRIQIPWKMPPEIKLDPSWSVGGGENGKENEVQRNRNRREKEIIYRTVQETPSNPKEPWDIEMDYDDSLTPEIPIEQPPDVADSTETQAFPREYNPETMVVPSQGANSVASLPPALSQINKASAAEPDLELLAVLLKNPELVFALTSGQAANLSSEDTVKLLDMIKSGGAGVAGSVNGLGRKMEERVEVSLPSPTPSSNPGTSGWKGDAGRNAFPQQMPQVSSAHRSIPPERLSTPQPAVPSYSPDYYPMQTPASEMTSITKNTHFHNLSNMTVPSVWGESTSNVERAPLSTSYNLAEMQQPLFSNMARQQRQPQPLQQQQQRFSTPTYSPNPPMGKAVPPSESWRARQDLTSNYHYLENQNQYNASHGGHLQPHLSGPWEGYERVGSNQDFHSWSPDDDDSPSRNPGYMYGREPRTNPGRDYTSRGRNPAGYRGHTRQRGNRWPNRGGD